MKSIFATVSIYTLLAGTSEYLNQHPRLIFDESTKYMILEISKKFDSDLEMVPNMKEVMQERKKSELLNFLPLFQALRKWI